MRQVNTGLTVAGDEEIRAVPELQVRERVRDAGDRFVNREERLPAPGPRAISQKSTFTI